VRAASVFRFEELSHALDSREEDPEVPSVERVVGDRCRSKKKDRVDTTGESG
jgi:hypothetical protein